MLQTNRRQVEAWARGTGRTSNNDIRRIGQAWRSAERPGLRGTPTKVRPPRKRTVTPPPIASPGPEQTTLTPEQQARLAEQRRRYYEVTHKAAEPFVWPGDARFLQTIPEQARDLAQWLIDKYNVGWANEEADNGREPISRGFFYELLGEFFGTFYNEDGSVKTLANGQLTQKDIAEAARLQAMMGFIPYDFKWPGSG